MTRPPFAATPATDCTCARPVTVPGATVKLGGRWYRNVPPVCVTCRGAIPKKDEP